MKILKRYANRRLYDAGTSKTVTLDDVVRFIREGEEVQVVDNVSGEDVTVRILGQTFMKITTEGRSVEFGTFLLTSLIREVSENLSGVLLRLVQAGIGASRLTPAKLEKIVEDLIRNGELQVGEKPGLIEQLQEQLDRHGKELRERVREAARQLSGIAPGSLDEISGRLEEMARLLKGPGK